MIDHPTGLIRQIADRYGRRWRKIRIPRQTSKFQIENLEPRLLLSGDVLSIASLGPLDTELPSPLILSLDSSTSDAGSIPADASLHDLLTAAIARLADIGIPRENLDALEDSRITVADL